jgi:hypothetical protein
MVATFRAVEQAVKRYMQACRVSMHREKGGDA